MKLILLNHVIPRCLGGIGQCEFWIYMCAICDK